MKTFLTNLIAKEEALSGEEIADFMANEDKFGGSFVINMKTKPERLVEASRTLQKVGRNFTKFGAISGAKLLQQEPQDGVDLESKFSILRPGELGCLLSHLSLINLASMHPNEDNFTLIFEDDIVTSSTSIQDTLERVAKIDANEGVDIVYLGKCLECCSKMTRLDDNVWRAVAPSCCHAYAIKNGFAKRVISDLETCQTGAPNCDYFNRGIDSILGDYIINKESNGIVIHPAIFMQDVLTTSSDLRPEFLHNYLECRDTTGSQHHHQSQNDDHHSEKSTKVDISRMILFLIVGIIVIVILTKLISKHQKISLMVIIFVLFIYIVSMTLYFTSKIGNNNETRVEGKKITIESFHAPNLTNPVEAQSFKVDEVNLLTKDYKAFNPNAVLKDGNIITAFRVSNGKVSYPLIEVRDSNMKIIKSKRIAVTSRFKIVDYSMPLGFEDMRIFEHEGQMGLIGVNLDRNMSKLASMVVAMLDENFETKIVTHLTYPPLNNKPNKNWAPISLEGGLLGYVVNLNPLLIVKQVRSDGLCEAHVEGSDVIKMPPLRNSSVTMKWDKIPHDYRVAMGIEEQPNVYMILSHTKYVESDFLKGGKLVQYQHYITIIDPDSAKIRLSKPFHVEEANRPHIEYVSGFVFDADGNLIVMYGLRDEEAKYFALPAPNVKFLFR